MIKRIITGTLSLLLCTSCVLMYSCSGKNGSDNKTSEEQKAFKQNWETDSGRYYKSGKLIDGSLGDGFSFSADENGGIKVTAGKGTGYVPTTILKSRNKTKLDNLSVSLTPGKFDFSKDTVERSSVISLLWSVDPVKSIEESLTHYDYTATNGIRNSAMPSKGLCVVLNNSYEEYNGSMTASNVMITLVDGDFHDSIDNRLGYRWSFTARNFLSQSPYSDDTKIISRYERIDISKGLNFTVKPDTDRGYIVSINGVDYYSSDKIAYYPNNISDQYNESSMTYQRNDIDLSALKGAGDGYVNIGVSGSICDAGQEYEYTVTDINGVPAANWAGETAE